MLCFENMCLNTSNYSPMLRIYLCFSRTNKHAGNSFFTMQSSLYCTPKNASNSYVLLCITFPIIAPGAHTTERSYSNYLVKIWKEKNILKLCVHSLGALYPWMTSVQSMWHSALLPALPRQRIELLFDPTFYLEASFECRFDHIEVRDGPFSFSPIINRFCGSASPGRVLSSGRFMWIRFFSDEELEGSGFRVEYTFTAGD